MYCSFNGVLSYSWSNKSLVLSIVHARNPIKFEHLLGIGALLFECRITHCQFRSHHLQYIIVPWSRHVVFITFEHCIVQVGFPVGTVLWFELFDLMGWVDVVLANPWDILLRGQLQI